MKKTKIKPPPNWEDTPQSFERFERLAKSIMALPKHQLDKEAAKDSDKREKARKAKQ